MDANLQAFLRKQASTVALIQRELAAVKAQLAAQPQRALSAAEELDKVEGRRIEYLLTGSVEFDITDLATRGDPITLQVSQDGPFVMTHYPMVLWKPTAPSNTTNLGRWRPVCSAPLPTQQVTTDFIDLSYEIVDGGSQRNFQNAASLPVFSRPDNIVPCPQPTLFAPSAAIQFFPTYEAITFSGATPPTDGLLVVTFIGYRIVNL